MNDDLELASLISLLGLKGVRWAEVPERVEVAGSAGRVLEEYLSESQISLFENQEVRENSDRLVEEALNDIRTWREEGMQVLSILDNDYPLNLRTVYDRPPILFVRGTLLEVDRQAVAVVGSRAASTAALGDATSAATGLVEAGYMVLSGLAAGIDSAAHHAAMKSSGRTVAVLGTGLRRSYPKENRQLQAEIGERFALISQFWPDQPPAKHTFPMRNAVMSGLSKATLIIEAGERSGARIQARKALEHGRPVFLMRRVLEETKWAKEFVNRPGTMVVDQVEEVIARLEKLRADTEQLAA